MSFYHDSFLIPDFESEKISELSPVAEFISKRLVQYSISLRTADDQRERDEHLASMIICCASLSMLNIAYLTESDELLRNAKTLMRDMPQ